MFDTLCALPLTSELFTQSLHPTSPHLAVGLASGHVQLYQLPTASSPTPSTTSSSPAPSAASSHTIRSSLRRSSTDSSSPAASGLSLIETSWRTRRHKGSCRSLAFSPDGSLLFSAGTDGLVKCARSETGRVEAKIAVPSDDVGKEDVPCLVNALTHTAFLLGTDSGALHLYDTRMPGSSEQGAARGVFGDSTAPRPAQTWRPHGDYVTSATAIPPSASSTSGLPRQLVTTGDTTVSLLDVRKGIVGTSGEGKEVLASSVVVGDRVFTGDSGGNLVGWDRDVVKSWEDGRGRQKGDVKRYLTTPEGEKIEIGAPREEVIDAMVRMDGGVAGREGVEMAVLGWDTGRIEVVSLDKKGRRGRVESTFQCDDTEGVVALDFDAAGRLVAGAGSVVKIYGFKGDDAVLSEDEEGDEDGNGDEDGAESTLNAAGNKRAGGDVDDGSSDEGHSSSEEQKQPKKKKRKKQKQAKGKGAQQSFSFAGLD